MTNEQSSLYWGYALSCFLPETPGLNNVGFFSYFSRLVGLPYILLLRQAVMKL